MIYLTENQTINVATSSIVIKNNKSVGDNSQAKYNHLYGIYSANDDGFVVQKAGTKLYGLISKIDSVKNPLGGRIRAQQIDEIIFDDPKISREQTEITVSENTDR